MKKEAAMAIRTSCKIIGHHSLQADSYSLIHTMWLGISLKVAIDLTKQINYSEHVILEEYNF